MFYLYRITNKINGKIYIGQTNYPARRWSQHKHAAKFYNKGDPYSQVISRAISKYNIINFAFEVILACKTQEDIDFLEVETIKQYDSRNSNRGYNIDIGGIYGERSPDINKKVSLSLLKYYETHESALKGTKHSNEWKENISKGSMGKPGTNKGKKFSQDWINKIAVANTGRKASPETIIKLSESHKGKVAPNRKLSFEQAEEIRTKYNTGLFGQKQLGIEYGLSQDCIFNIVHNKTYNK